MLFLIAQIKRFGTLNATKNRSPRHSNVLEKIRKNCLKIVKNAFLEKKNNHFLAVFLDFSRTVLCRGLWFFALCSVSQDAQFKLLKTIFGNIFKKFTIWGSLMVPPQSPPPKLYRSYYQQRSRELVTPVCGIFSSGDWRLWCRLWTSSAFSSRGSSDGNSRRNCKLFH